MTTIPATVQERIALPAGAQSGWGAQSSGPTAADIYSMLRRRSVLISVLFIVFVGMTGGGFALWWVVFPGYTAECLIECVSNIPETQLSMDQQRLREDEHERFVRTQAMFIKSPTILSETLKITEVRNTQWYKSCPPNEQLIELTDELVAQPVRGTNFLRVALESRKIKDPAIIVNEVVDQWYHLVRQRSADEFAAGTLPALKQEKIDLERSLSEKRGRLKRLAELLPPGARLDPANNVTAQQARDFSGQAAMLRLELTQLEQFRALYNDPKSIAVTAEDRAIVEQDPEVLELTRMKFMLEQQLAADENVYGSKHVEYKRTHAQIEAAKKTLAELRMRKYAERRADMREATNTGYENTRFALFTAEEQLARSAAAVQDQDRLLFDYTQLDADIVREEERKQLLDDEITSLTRVKTQKTAINVNIAQRAVDPMLRSSPSLLLIPVGIFLAMGLSVGIGLSVELLDKSLRTPQDLVRHLDTAMLGVVPDIDDEEINIEHVETVMRDMPRTMIAEAFRRIRTNLQFSCPADLQRCVMITSPRPDDGKTTIACNLAIAVAQSGRRVLLVDANLRRPAVQTAFPQIKREGLSNILIGEGSLEQLVTSTDVPMLDVLGGGPAPPNPAELLGGETFRVFLEAAKSKYDQIILDTSPILLSADALVLAPSADGVILVIRARQSSRGVARRAWSLLSDVGARMFGAVLNAAQVSRGGYYREQLRAYYEYQAETDTGDQRQALTAKSLDAMATDDEADADKRG